MNLLFDIGGTNMRFAFSGDSHQLDEVMILPTPKTYKDALDTFRAIMTAKPVGSELTQVIGGVPRFAKNNLTFWHRHSAASAIQKITNAPVQLMNDAELGGLGEAHFGAGQNAKIMAYVTFSTGFGGARIVNKQIDANHFGFEPKLQIIDINGGHYPAVSDQVTGRGLKNQYGKPAEDLTRKAVWRAVEQWMGVALNNVAVFWSPEIIVLGGAVSSNEHISIPRLNAFLSKRFKNMPKRPKIVKAKLGQLNGLYGALSLTKK